MNWITIYIAGKPHFQDDIRRRLEKSGLPVMSGNMGSTINKRMHDLYWLGDTVGLREFKQAIGGKLIWKYRLRFYTQMETFIESQNAGRKGLALRAEDHEWSNNAAL